MRENTRTESDIFVEVALSEAVATELELGWVDVGQVSIKYAERVKICLVVSAHLISTNKELDLGK